MNWIQRNSLWIVGFGLMAASSGIDGAYMARWMVDLPGLGGAALLGYILNTTSDVANLVLTYWYGRLRMDRSSTKRRLANVLLGAEVIAVLYSWFFGWRQLLLVLPPVEGAATPGIAFVSAGFIPLLLGFTGYAQSLLAGRIESEPSSKSSGELAAAKLKLRGELAKSVLGGNGGNGSGHKSEAQELESGAESEESFKCEYCGRGGFRSTQAVSAHKQFCELYQRAQKRGETE